MANWSTQKQQQEEALTENLYATKCCLDFNKKTSPDFNDTKDGCLGYPAFILLASVIDTIGSFFRDTECKIIIDSEPEPIEKAAHHFYILNHEKLFNLNLKSVTIDDFYRSYRSPMTHNNSLPENRFLENDKNKEEIFELNQEGKIATVNLFSLFKITEKATEHFLHWLRYGTFSEGHKLTQELLDKAIPFSSTGLYPISNQPTSSGYSSQENGTIYERYCQF